MLGVVLYERARRRVSGATRCDATQRGKASGDPGGGEVRKEAGRSMPAEGRGGVVVRGWAGVLPSDGVCKMME